MRDDVYTEMVYETRAYPRDHLDGITYCALGLAGEAGEVANQVKKVFRDDDYHLTDERKAKIKDELGDVLWYLVALSDELGFTLDEIKTANADKLLNRKANDTINGDRRDSAVAGRAADDEEWYLG